MHFDNWFSLAYTQHFVLTQATIPRIPYSRSIRWTKYLCGCFRGFPSDVRRSLNWKTSASNVPAKELTANGLCCFYLIDFRFLFAPNFLRAGIIFVENKSLWVLKNEVWLFNYIWDWKANQIFKKNYVLCAQQIKLLSKNALNLLTTLKNFNA